jgi:predicted ATPase with chaperone activity
MQSPFIVSASMFDHLSVWLKDDCVCNHIVLKGPVRAFRDIHPESAIDEQWLSARAFNRIQKIARTIADLQSEQNLQVDHISEAIQYRNLDQNSQFK